MQYLKYTDKGPIWQESVAKFMGTEASVEKPLVDSSGLPQPGQLHTLHFLHYIT